MVTLDEAVYRQNMQILSANGLQVTRFTDSSLEGSLTAAKAGTVFTSIPYDAGWSVKVDGKAVETYAVCDGALLAFDIDAGAHTVEMRFLPRGLVPGIVISLLCLAILIIVSVVLPRRRAKRPPVPGDGERSPAEKAPEGPGGTASSAGEADAARSAASSQPEVPLYQPGPFRRSSCHPSRRILHRAARGNRGIDALSAAGCSVTHRRFSFPEPPAPQAKKAASDGENAEKGLAMGGIV